MDVLFSIDDNMGVYQKKDKAVIYNVDCRYILEKIGNESVDLFVSDVPYKIAHKGTSQKKER